MTDSLSGGFPTQELRALALRFPSLVSAPLHSTEALGVWAQSQGSGAAWAAVFVLSVWNDGAPEELGLPRFDVHRAMSAWDHAHRAAFASWARSPFWG